LYGLVNNVVFPTRTFPTRLQYEAGSDVLAKLVDTVRGTAGSVATIETTGNSFSKEACDALAAELAKKGEIQVVLMNDMFTRRKVPEIHPALSNFGRVFSSSTRLRVLDLRQVPLFAVAF
jgi:Ran GTPase-activating protein (RanGAP) involved in mRNA processing and transport